MPFPLPLSLGGIAGAECTDPGLARPGFLFGAFLGVCPFSAGGGSAACALEGSIGAEVSAWASEGAASADCEVSASPWTAGPAMGGAASGTAVPVPAFAVTDAAVCTRFDRLFPSLGAIPDIGRAKAPLPMRGAQSKKADRALFAAMRWCNCVWARLRLQRAKRIYTNMHVHDTQ